MADLLKLFSYGTTGWGDEILAGAWLTIRLALATLPFGLLVGFGVALMKRSKSRWVHGLASIYATVFRGLPELLTLFLIYYGGQLVVQKLVGLISSDVQIQASAFLAGMIALGLVFAAYASEVFASAFQGITRGQWEGAHAIGLNRTQTMLLVIVPQLLRLALPGLANLWLNLLKDTSLVSVIALADLLRQTSLAVHVTKQPFPFYLVACLLYLVMSIISTFGIVAIERWAERGQGRRTNERGALA
ncbi:amino acid ABC transporter membrane protein 1, PAAT family [Faunimonas pinastri]|uniref:Amino acid ABC transporter membrane protein 1, PAAT family n=1 Tax=Faunimonas pinastri TaxID=1855383 RepID=A0A1H9JH50_9HYPH|nr:ABC transporter permease [Faunimonas pinastri]SEQ86109.1 amino acid ABC transporter membrane protein 1, PAAT family [Faunimonas pinastri]